MQYNALHHNNLISPDISMPKPAHEFMVETLRTMNEEEISKDSYYSYYYTRYITGKRFPLGEKAISEDAHSSYFYAKNVIKGRFELGEEAISQSVEFSLYYAFDLNSRFKLGEKVIRSNSDASITYTEFLKKILTKEEFIQFKLEF